MGTDDAAGGRLAPETDHPPSLAERSVRRQTPEVGAVCGKAARTVLCGGRSAMSVPTATGALRAACPRVCSNEQTNPRGHGRLRSATAALAHPTMSLGLSQLLEQAGEPGVAAGGRGPLHVHDLRTYGLEVGCEQLEADVDDARRRREQIVRRAVLIVRPRNVAQRFRG